MFSFLKSSTFNQITSSEYQLLELILISSKYAQKYYSLYLYFPSLYRSHLINREFCQLAQNKPPNYRIFFLYFDVDPNFLTLHIFQLVTQHVSFLSQYSLLSGHLYLPMLSTHDSIRCHWWMSLIEVVISNLFYLYLSLTCLPLPPLPSPSPLTLSRVLTLSSS